MNELLATLRAKGLLRPIAVSVLLAALFVTTRVLPNERGGSGSPPGVLLMGVVMGLIVALTAVGIVLVYRTSRIVNFAQAALGAIGAAFAANFVVRLHWPYGLAFVVAILIGALIGLVGELILRRFFDAPRLVLTVATVGLFGLATQFTNAVPFLPIWGDEGSVTERLTPTIRPLRGCCFDLAPFRFEFAHVLTLVLAPVVLLAVAAFLTKTRAGIAVRAAAENLERAEMLGINVRMLSMLVWSIAGALAGIAVTLQATATSFALGGIIGIEALLPALAAAMLAGMRSLPLAVIAAVALTVLERALRWSFPEQVRPIYSVVLLAIIVVTPLLMRKVRGRERESSSWEAAEEARPIPPQLAMVSEVRTWRNAFVALGVAAVLLFPWISTTGPTNLAGVAAITGIVLLSLVVLTGWTGQVSLGHWGLVAVGALAGGALTGKLGWSFWIALPVGSLVTALFAGLIAIPALRIRGLMLAVTTFAFSFVAWLVLFDEKWFGWLLPERVERPTLLLLDFEDERSMYYLTVLFLALSFGLVALLRRGRPGRVLLALRENEDELASIGVNPALTRLSGFVLSGFLAGLAGVLFAHHQRAVTQTSFEPAESLQLFLYAVIGGLGAPMGALIGAFVRLLFQVLPQDDPFVATMLNPSFGVLAILYLAPRGGAGLVQAMRDSVLRIIAQRRGIVAPSLFADVDAEAIERRLVLIAEPLEGRGLAALDGKRYRLSSEIYATNGARDEGAPDERKALAAAAEALYERSLAPSTNGDVAAAGAKEEK